MCKLQHWFRHKAFGVDMYTVFLIYHAVWRDLFGEVTFYLVKNMNTTILCFIRLQLSQVTQFTRKDLHTWYGTPFATLMFFWEARFSPLWVHSLFLIHVRIFIQDFMDWTTLVTLAATWESSTNGSQSPLKNKAEPPKGKACLPAPPFFRTNMFVLGCVWCAIYIYIFILYLYLKL